MNIDPNNTKQALSSIKLNNISTSVSHYGFKNEGLSLIEYKYIPIWLHYGQITSISYIELRYVKSFNRQSGFSQISTLIFPFISIISCWGSSFVLPWND